MEKERIINLITNANINDNDWWYDILENMNDKYARGYIHGIIGMLNNSFCSDDEEFREELLKICKYNIWDK